MTRVPLLAGTRLVVVTAGDDDVVLAPPPPPREAIADVGAAVRNALRFPLAGEPLEALLARGGRATIVVEQPTLPVPGSPRDPRRAALAATVEELERLGIPTGYQTLLVAGGLARRATHRDLEALVEPEFARRFHGHVVVHDVEDPELVELPAASGPALHVNPALAATDLVVVVTAAETTLHGGPAALLGASGPETLRAAGGASLLETGGSPGWELGLGLERALGRRVPMIGVSLALNQVRVGGAARGYPFETEAIERIARSPFRHLFGLLPGSARAQILRSFPTELSAAAVFAGPPSVAHAEALLRAVELRAADLTGRLDAICIGIPRTTPYLPRERPNPLLAAYLGLALALRLWRDAFPVADGGTAILLHRFHRRYAHPTQHPYRLFFQAIRAGRSAEALVEAEREAVADERAIDGYRAGRTCHPALPYADWAACGPALEHLGAVLIAGCRDSVAARQLGFVPTHGVGAALTMAHGRAGRPPRVGFLLSPPYFPLRVTTT